MRTSSGVAVFDQPRLFAVHGLRTLPEEGHILGWGMEFAEDLGALYTDPVSGTTHRSPSAEGVLRTLRRVGDVELTWLTGDPVPNSD
jgi:hypothetical protein